MEKDRVVLYVVDLVQFLFQHEKTVKKYSRQKWIKLVLVSEDFQR